MVMFYKQGSGVSEKECKIFDDYVANQEQYGYVQPHVHEWQGHILENVLLNDVVLG